VAVRSFNDSTGTQWTVWAVRPQPRERRESADRRSGRDRRRGSIRLPWLGRRPERRTTPERRLTSDRRLTPGSRAAILPGLEHGWLCFEGGGVRRRLTPIPLDWEGCDLPTLQEYQRRATLTRPSR
jgi:hypothetical protein